MPSLIRFAVFCLLASSILMAQVDANKGRIVGTVYDPNQAVIPGATVRLKNLDTSAERALTTDQEGRYQAVLLDPGTYELRASSSGFAESTVSGVVLNVGTALTVDVTLQLQATVTTVEVGEALVNVTTATSSAVVNSTAVTNLPINGRRFQDFALLTPTVLIEPQRQQLSFAGQRGINSNVMVDGADYNQPFFGGIRGGERSNFAFTVPQSAIQEFQVVPTGYTAEYGRSTGGVLNAITKSGSNDYHGDAFYLLRHKEFGAATPFKDPNGPGNIRGAETQHQFGGSVGGPIKRDKLFFFAAGEAQKASFPRLVDMPRLDSADRNAGPEAYDYYSSLQESFRTSNDAQAFTGRLDYAFTGGHRLTLRYNNSGSKGQDADSVGSALDTTTTRSLQANGDEEDYTHLGNVQFTTLFGPTLINDLRFGASHEERPRSSNSFTPGVSSSIGDFGARSFRPTVQDDFRWQVADSLSFVAGAHTLKVGFDYNRVTAAQIFGFNQFGFFSFGTSDTNTLLDLMSVGGKTANRFDSAQVTYRRQIGNLTASMGMHQVAGFIQDNWRVTPQLTLDLGFRWEGQFNPTPEANNAALVDPVQNTAFPAGRLDPTVIPDATRQLMPRFGLAYRPFQTNFVIRGQVGIFYASTPLLLFAGPVNNYRDPPGDLSIQLPVRGSTVYKDFLKVGIDLNQTPLDQLPVLTIEQVQEIAGSGVDPYRGAAPIAVANDFENPRSWQWGLGFEQEVVRDLIVGANFNYVNTVHLERNVDLNMPLPVLVPSDLSERPVFGLRSGAQVRPIPTLNSVQQRSSSARSMYRGVSFSARYRRSRIQFAGFYTYSNSVSDDDNERDAGGQGYVNLYDLPQELGPSRLDIRHQFTGNAVATLPWGLETAGIVRVSSGAPFDAYGGSDLNGDFVNNDRPFAAPGVPFERNSYRNRGYRTVDFRVLKNFPLKGERTRLQLSFEFFNLFNFDNVIYGGNNMIYGPGISAATGQPVAPPANFMRLKLADGTYDRNNSQRGGPFQGQVGLRFFF